MEKRCKNGIGLISIGLVFMIAALILAGYNVWSEVQVKRTTEITLQQLKPYVLEAVEKTNNTVQPDGSTRLLHLDVVSNTVSSESAIPDYILNPSIDMPEQMINGHSYIGMLSIPALGLDLPVMSEWNYDNLRIAPCRYSGSAYWGNLVICAHNYTVHFGNLKDIPLGSEIVFVDMDGNVFRYRIVETETVEPHAIEYMENGNWDLTLFTCTIGGTYRLAVRCILMQDLKMQ